PTRRRAARAGGRTGGRRPDRRRAPGGRVRPRGQAARRAAPLPGRARACEGSRAGRALEGQGPLAGGGAQRGNGALGGVRGARLLRPVTAEGLRGDLAARRAAITSLRARARLKSGVTGLWTREALLVRRPDAVRIDVLSPFGLALAVGVQGPLLWAYPPAESTRYEGSASAANL